MNYSAEMNREIIMDHINRPRNIASIKEGYLSYTIKNPSCGDIVTVYLKMENDKIIDIKHSTEGCAIATASTSIVSELLKDKTKSEVFILYDKYNKLLTGEIKSDDSLMELNAFSTVSNMPTRIKCANLSFKAVIELLSGSANV